MPLKDLEEMWQKRKHIFFDSGGHFWLQVTDSDNLMDQDDASKFSNLCAIEAYRKINNNFKPIERSAFRLKDGSFSFKVHLEEVPLCKTITEIDGTPVKVLDHPFKNRCRGKVFSFQTINMTEETIRENIIPNIVTKVVKKSFIDKATEEKKYSGELTLTFNCDPSSKPEEVVLGGYIYMRVEPYTPRPLLCRNCFQYGNHLTTECKQEQAICGWCSEAKHVADREQCKQQSKCYNCKANHPSWSSDCPAYQREKDTLELKEQEGISYKRAKSMVTGDKEKKTTAKAVFAAESSGRQQAELERRLEEADKVFQERLQENNRMWQERLDKRENDFALQMENIQAHHAQELANHVKHYTQQLANQMEHYNKELAKQNNIITQQLAGIQQHISQEGQKKGILAGTTPMLPPLNLPMQFTPDVGAYVQGHQTGNTTSLLPFEIPVATPKHPLITSPSKEANKIQRVDPAAKDPGDAHK